MRFLLDENVELRTARHRDFGQLVFELGIPCPTILLRFRTTEPLRWFEALDALVRDHGDLLSDHFVTLTEDVARIRPLPA